ncbi:MAG: hypothetical protein Q7R59_01950 [bacterium]|nr:hypothetical protein [bacterium]
MNLWLVLQQNLDSKGILANFLGGLGVVILLFILNELFRPKKNLTGEWDVTNTVLDTAYNPYKGLKVVWKMHILQNGNTITGSGEKIKDIRLDNGVEKVYEFEPAKRDTVELQGYIEKNYLIRKSRVFINVIQVGQSRKSRATYILKLRNDSTLVGTFVATAANSKGTSIFSKNV